MARKKKARRKAAAKKSGRTGKAAKRKGRSKPAAKPKSSVNGIMDMVKELWEAAVALRGSIEPADCKRYVLPLIFLRHLSLRYEQRRAELEAMIADPKNKDYHTTNRKAAQAILDQPDEYTSAGAFLVPKKARWDEILKMARADDLKVKLDEVLKKLEDTFPKLKGLLPPIYAGSNMDREDLASLINLFSRDVFKEKYRGEDLIGRVYEYFIGEFAASEGKRGGEYFTPLSIVRLLVAMLEPEEGVVFDPCCGSGGMFVQSDIFTGHSHRLSFVGQESKDFTQRLCKMNLFIHGIDGDIALGNSYHDDKHSDLKADYVIANPPFNDGAKSKTGWGASLIDQVKDPRLEIGDRRISLSPRNANTMWIPHFLHHLKDGGTAGFVMATGELSNNETARRACREALVEADVVDCIVQLPGQLFANTGIPCCLWFLSKSRGGGKGYRKRAGEILFVDARKRALLIPGSRKQKELSDEEIEEIAATYRGFRRKKRPEAVAGFCAAVTSEDVRNRNYALAPGRYVGSEEPDDDGEPFEEKMPRLAARLREQLKESVALGGGIEGVLRKLGL